jgi:hypothetical protein
MVSINGRRFCAGARGGQGSRGGRWPPPSACAEARAEAVVKPASARGRSARRSHLESGPRRMREDDLTLIGYRARRHRRWRPGTRRERAPRRRTRCARRSSSTHLRQRRRERRATGWTVAAVSSVEDLVDTDPKRCGELARSRRTTEAQRQLVDDPLHREGTIPVAGRDTPGPSEVAKVVLQLTHDRRYRRGRCRCRSAPCALGLRPAAPR